jgi:hypothetical protein
VHVALYTVYAVLFIVFAGMGLGVIAGPGSDALFFVLVTVCYLLATSAVFSVYYRMRAWRRQHSAGSRGQ